MLEPLFLKNGVSVVFTGHDHFYERIKPQQGIMHFVVGSGGQLRRGNIDGSRRSWRSGSTPIRRSWSRRSTDDRLTFNTISRTGAVIDSGVIERRQRASSVAFDASRRSARGRALGFQSASNTAWIFRAIAAVGDDDADLAAAVELQLAQALAADERRRAVAHDGAHVQPQVGQLARLDAAPAACRPCR